MHSLPGRVMLWSGIRQVERQGCVLMTRLVSDAFTARESDALVRH